MTRFTTRDIEARLKQVRARIRRMQALRGLMLISATLLLGLLVAMAIDLVFAPVPQAVRLAVFVAWLVVLVWMLKVGFGPMFRRIDLVRIARWLEQRHPEMDERLSTALELSNNESVSPDLMEALVEAADRDVGTLDPRVEVAPGAGVRRWRRVAAVCAAVILAALVIQPAVTTRLLLRAVAPFSDVGNAGAMAFEIEPKGLEVLEGDAIEIRVRCEEEPELVIDLDSGESVTQPLVPVDGAWVYQLEPAREGFRYRARAARAESDAFEALVWPYPRLVSSRVTLDFPDYTGRASSQMPLEKRIEEVAGTSVALISKLNTPVESAWLMMPDGRRVDCRLESSATETRLTAEWKLEPAGNGEVVLWVHHRLDRDIELMRFEQTAVGDKPPMVVLLSPVERELKLREDETLDLRYEVTEDIGVARVGIEVDAGGKGKFQLDRMLPQKLEEPSEFQRFRGEADLSVGEVRSRTKDAREFKFRVVAEDARPQDIGGPGRGFSEWVVVKVQRNAESMARQKLRSDQDDVRKVLEKAMQETRVAEQKMHQNRPLLEKAEPDEWSEKLSEETVEKLAGAEKSLEELAKRMEEGIHAAKSDKVEKAAEQLEQALEAFEEVPLQDEKEQRGEKLDEALAATKEALKTMEEVRQEIEKEQPRIDDLARMEELAQQQEELARQANEMAANQEEVTEEWRREQQRMEEELRDQLNQRPEALAEAIKDQAEAAMELSQEARELAEDQQKLEQIVAEKADKPSADELREALAEAQAELAEEARDQAAKAEQQESASAESADQAAEQTEKAAEEMAKEDASTESAKQSAEAAREAAEKLESAAKEAAAEQDAMAETGSESGEPGAEEPGAEAAANETDPQEAASDSTGEQGDEAGREETAQSGEEKSGETGETGEPSEAAQAESGESEKEGAERAEAMADLAERQAQLADAAEALAEGNLEQAAESLEAATDQADDALAEALGEMLAEEQAAIAEAVGEQLDAAREQRSEMADQLPEAAQATSEASEALAEGDVAEAAEQASEAGGALSEAAAQSQELAESQAAESSAGAAEAQAMSEALEGLSERQEQLNEAIESLESGDLSAALEQVQEMQAAQAAELAQELANVPSPQGSPLQGAAAQAQKGSQQAAQAAQQSQSGQMAQSAASHDQSGESLEQAAESLEQAAARLAERADAAEQRQTPQYKAPVGAEALAEAFQQAAEAADATQPGEAAQQAAQSAEALAQSAQQARSEMQGRPMPGPPGQPAQPGQPSPPNAPPGSQPGDEMRMPQPAPGVPDELAKLGISAEDWEKIQASLKSDVGAGGADGVPEDYRGLVKDYFEKMTER
jgi:DNA segregation ATPase FtsK/SpoIIIE-like protein